MSNGSVWGDRSCTDVMRLIGAAVGLLVFLVLWLGYAPGFLMSLFWGIVIYVIIGWIVAPLVCRDSMPATTGGTGTAPKPAAAAPAPKPAEAPKPAPAAEKAPAPAPKPAAEPAPKAASGGGKPAALSAPRGGKADDLKMIKGVGPGLEKMLNGMGIYHFDQIAAWSADEVAHMDANMPRFKGRASRDGWVDQAKALASGGETEFSSRAKKDGIYD